MLCSTLRQLVALTFDQYRVKFCATAIFLCFTLLPTLAAAQKVLGRAPDASKARDPFKRTSGYYIFDFAEDKDVLPGCMADGNYDCKIQIFAQVYRPNNLDSGPYPLIIFLHGNHMTCGKPNTTLPGNPRDDDNIQFTKDGTCPAAP
jgi:acetyl esterase/lipase